MTMMTMKSWLRSRAAVLWGVALFAALQLGLALTTEYWLPGLRDREYGVKLELLGRRTRERPDRPFVVVLGSSRVAVGLRPGESEGGPLVFNFGILGGGPLTQQVVLDRLLRHGVRPDGVLLEVWPPLMHHVAGSNEEVRQGVNRLGLADALLTARYAEDGPDFLAEWLQDWLTPWYSNRGLLLASAGLEDLKGDRWQGVEADGWRVVRWDCATDQGGDPFAAIRRKYRMALARYQMDANADRALREAVARCRHEGIPVALLYMPESRPFRAYYKPPLRAALDDYLNRLREECDVAVIDCRDMADDDRFPDGFHLSPAGAVAFSERFAAEVLPRIREYRAVGTAGPR